jgi:uncharacterized protein YkwD
VPTGTPARHRAAHGRTRPQAHPLAHPPPDPSAHPPPDPSAHPPPDPSAQPPAHPVQPPAYAPARRVWYLTCGLLVLAAVGLYLARGSGSAPSASGRVTTLQTSASCGPADGDSCTGRPFHAGLAPVPTASWSPSPARTKRTARHATPSASPSSSPAAPSSAASPAAPATGSAGAAPGSPAAQVLALINQARSAAGLAPLTVTAGLDRSASGHNQVMASGCGLSHQCPGEPDPGARETAAGVLWSTSGENIGEGGPVADTTAGIAQMAVGLTQDMLNEQPPDDGHRLNILSSSFTHIGTAVYRSPSGTVWLTQDFSN